MTKVAKKVETANEAVKEPKAKSTRRPSMEKIGEDLYAANASLEKAVEKFTTEYKIRKGVTDPKFIEARTKIYLRIAERRALIAEEEAK